MEPAHYLFRFGYTWPSELLRIGNRLDLDLLEDSEMIFIGADSNREVIELGGEFAECFIRRLYGVEAYSWKEVGFASWIESDEEIMRYAKNNSVPKITSKADIESMADVLANRRKNVAQQVGTSNGLKPVRWP